MSRLTRSTGFFDESPVSGSAGTLYQCKCGRPFIKAIPEQVQCRRCRHLQLLLDARRSDTAEIDAFNQLRDSFLEDHSTDWQIFDEDHCLCWALDLAKRYRVHTKPRSVRSSIRKWI